MPSYLITNQITLKTHRKTTPKVKDGRVQKNFDNALLIYPNPTDGNFSIDLGGDYQGVLIIIVDIYGQQVLSIAENNGQLLNLKLEEPARIYFLTIESGNKKAVILLVKE